MDARVLRVALIAAVVLTAAACGDQETTDAADAKPANQPPVISGTPSTTVVAEQTYDFKPTASDPDGDPIIFGIDGKPSWMSFDTSTGELTGKPHDNNVGKHRGIVIWVSDGQSETLMPTLDVEVLPAPTTDNQPPEISGTPASSVMVDEFYDFIPTVVDPEGDPMSFTIDNPPAWADFDATIGRLSGTPGASDVGDYANIVINVSDGTSTSSLGPFLVVVNPAQSQNSAPVISGQPDTSVTVGNAYAFTPSASDADGDSLRFTIFNQPGWSTFNTATGALTGSPASADAGTYGGISIVVSDGQASAALPGFSIEVIDPNSPPVISGNPPTTVEAGSAYAFTPQASDADRDPLSFSISGRPSWASFDGSTGRLSGTPGLANVGTYNNIRISVSDGSASASLAAFSITVKAGNSAPVISGTPPGAVTVGSPYSFTPQASDADNDSLRFSVSGLPGWASFDTATGSVTGTPGAGDVGTYSNIVITVSDGVADDSLSAFSIDVSAVANGSATLTWTPPTENTDGTPLGDLAGYKVYWGTAPGTYSNSVDLANPGLTSYVVDNLLPGTTYYFVATAYNASGLESAFSNEASKTIP